VFLGSKNEVERVTAYHLTPADRVDAYA